MTTEHLLFLVPIEMRDADRWTSWLSDSTWVNSNKIWPFWKLHHPSLSLSCCAFALPHLLMQDMKPLLAFAAISALSTQPFPARQRRNRGYRSCHVQPIGSPIDTTDKRQESFGVWKQDQGSGKMKKSVLDDSCEVIVSIFVCWCLFLFLHLSRNWFFFDKYDQTSQLVHREV